MPQLRYQNRQGRTALLDLDQDEVSIGRLSKCDIVISQPTVSRRHAVVFRRGKRWVIADQGSSHGTLVNGTWIVEKVLAPGDQISIGPEVITFVDGQDAVSRRPEPVEPSPFDDGSDATSSGDDERRDIAEIIAEHALESGQIMTTIARTRRLDVTQIIDNPQQLIAALAKPAPLPLATKAKEEPFEQPATATAGPETGGAADSEARVASRLLTLVRISDEMRRCTDVGTVCRTAVEMAMTATRANRGVLALRTGDGDFVPMVQRVDGRESSKGVRLSKTFVDRVVNKRVALVALDTGQDRGLAIAKSVVAFDIRSILCAPLWDGEEILGYLYLDSSGIGRHFGHDDLDFVTAVGHQAASEIARLRLMARIQDEQERRHNLARFLAPDIIKHIDEEAAAGRLEPALSAREQQVTILFSDIQGFTTLSERMGAAEVKRLLDDYFDCMTEILVDRYRGTLDKYIGDAIMALFGAPFSDGIENDTQRAVAAAVEMRDTLNQMRAQQPEYAHIQARIGINTGRVIAGMMGSQRRLEYSVIGDAVNVASRLESSTAPGTIQIGESTYEIVKRAFHCEFAGERKVKNRRQPVRAWTVLAPRTTA
ncbi:MAG: FHA domain-containing protein [Deltaproteobacteria bacterium]|nr:FHA domain-containing protein [Deltaproteobacteria bacterium]